MADQSGPYWISTLVVERCPYPSLIIPLGPSSALKWPIKALKRHIFLYSSYTNGHKPYTSTNMYWSSFLVFWIQLIIHPTIPTVLDAFYIKPYAYLRDCITKIRIRHDEEQNCTVVLSLCIFWNSWWYLFIYIYMYIYIWQ